MLSQQYFCHPTDCNAFFLWTFPLDYTYVINLYQSYLQVSFLLVAFTMLPPPTPQVCWIPSLPWTMNQLDLSGDFLKKCSYWVSDSGLIPDILSPHVGIYPLHSSQKFEEKRYSEVSELDFYNRKEFYNHLVRTFHFYYHHGSLWEMGSFTFQKMPKLICIYIYTQLIWWF